MKPIRLPNAQAFRDLAAELRRRLLKELSHPYVKTGILLVAAYLATQKEVTFRVSISSSGGLVQITEQSRIESLNEAGVSNVSQLTSYHPDKQIAKPERKLTPAQREKRRKQLAYVKTYQKVAQLEMETHGIPASITLAQGLLESNIGQSRLATRNQNHFGIKCFSKSCNRGHCSNFEDDSHKDFFRIYASPEESYRAHSQVLQNNRYRKLFDLPKSDYRSWALGLRKAGYATDRSYGEKLIRLIEELELDRYDS
jgi:flagellum-specific peptidoglycan hydrolase FlgJ